MLHCYYRGVMFWAVGSILLVGCASSSHPPGAQPGTVGTAGRDGGPPTHALSPESDDALVSAHAHYAQGMMYDLEDQPELALEEFSQSALDDPGNEELVLDLARRYLQRKEPEQALKLLTKATTRPDASGALFARLGLVYSRLGEDQKAIEACQTGIKRAPNLLAGYQNLFLIHLKKGRPQEALNDLNLAGKAPGAGAEFLIGLSELYATLERQAPSERASAHPGALAALNRAAQLNPGDAQLRMKLADGYNLLGDKRGAEGIYLQLLGQYSGVPAVRDDVRGKLADIYLRDNDLAKATEQLEALVRDDPANAQAYYYLGRISYQAKKLPAAADYFRKALLLSDGFEEAYYDLANVQINLDQPQEALATLAKAGAKFRPSFVAEFLTGVAYKGGKDYTNALNHFTAAEVIAKATAPERLDKMFYFEIGSTCERKGDYEQAEKCFEQSLKLSPDFAEALNYLGYMLADRGVKLQRALGLIERAVALEPESAAYLDSLGWALYKLNRPQEALARVQKAIALSPEADATLFDHLGDIYAALKQADKAREAWLKSLAVEPNEQVRKKLDGTAGNSNR